jgi:AraC family transcriptional regulator, transcriptional activator of pobA
MLTCKQNVTGYYISFLKDHEFTVELELFLFKVQTKPYIDFSEEDGDSIKAILNLIIKELATAKLYHRTVVHFLLNSICSLIKRHRGAGEDAPLNDLTKLFFSELSLVHSVKKTVKELAESLYVSTVYLNQIIKSTTSYDARYWLKKTVLIEAKRLLAFTDKPIDTVSHALGFEDPTYFYKYFKRYTEKTPLQFRKSYVEKNAEILFDEKIKGE